MNETDENKIAISNVKKRSAKSRLIFLLSFLGNFVCIALVIAKQRGFIVSDAILYIALFAMLVFLLLLCWIWHESLDEFEKAAIGKASFWGISSGAIILPWMLLYDVEMAPRPNAMYIVILIFLITISHYYCQKLSGNRPDIKGGDRFADNNTLDRSR